MGVLARRFGLAVLVPAVWLSLCVTACGPKAGEVKINPKDGAEMVWIPGGEFLMGTSDDEVAAMLKKHPDWEAEWFAHERPQREVYLDGYWMYKHEVTVAQYRKFCEATEREMPDAPEWGWKDDHPMVMVNWDDAAAYAKWAGCRLPTEAEWEKAARGTDGRRYPWGDEWDASKCVSSAKKKASGTEPVGSRPAGASPYGCQDMAGNVWEWCADWYGRDYYKNAPSRNPQGPAEPVEFELVPGLTLTGDRVLRAASWSRGYVGYDGSFRCAGRYGSLPASRYNYLGFRCARSPD